MTSPKRILTALAAAAVLAVTVPADAQLKLTQTENTKLFMTLNTVGTLQALEHKNVFDVKGVAAKQLSPGFQNAFGDLGFIAKVGKNDELEVVFDMYLSSRNHPSSTYGNEGYMILRGVPENLQSLNFLKPVLSKVDIKAGHFLLGFGDAIYHRSNNAIVQKNPLVGNFVVDPNIVSIAMEVSSKPGKRYGWVAGVSNGTTTEDFSLGREFAYHGKLIAYPIESLRTSVSYIKADQGNNPTKAGGGSAIQMFSGNRSGERYAGVLGGGQAPGGVLPQAGEDFSAAQVDVTWDDSRSPLKLYANYGRTQDKDLNGSAAGAPEETWNYYAADAVYNITPTLYAAARYSAATTDMLQGAATDGSVRRYQIGGGFWLTRNVLMKVEYVDQQYSGFRAGQVVNNGIDAGKSPSFKGVISEVSFSF
jgi:hypothetical protein